ncbi:hypothetical protein ND856_19110 [Leptospira bandrabouensis]|uniref:hypothetical protein n=1 Tax=Leptospira bandrabouensis TaxID=2484903 RepID=UPI00223E37F0|nr:hypothetical protein [Leptospira bandrabouensis]MCW7479418.1 hypothetical protein [Leptospira bandrabouensis]MCW7487100.1 hypothetical protein [Leptospira bandrabouensis]
MKTLIDTNILYYLRPNFENPLDHNKLFQYLESCLEIKVTQLNFLEFYTSEKLTNIEKIDILKKILTLNIKVENLNREATRKYLHEKIKILKSFQKFSVSKQGNLQKKQESEKQILVEFFESIIAIFAIYLNFESPLADGIQSKIFEEQFTSLIKGNLELNDDYIEETIKNLYKNKINKDFRKSLIQQIFIMLFLTMHNFSASKAEAYLSEINEKKITDEKYKKYEDYLANNELFKKILDIINTDSSDTKLPIKHSDSFMNLAIIEYKKFLPNHNYSNHYIEAISIVFKNILINGSKFEKNDAIDLLQFQYIDEYQLLSLETKLKNLLEKIDPNMSANMGTIIDNCRK